MMNQLRDIPARVAEAHSDHECGLHGLARSSSSVLQGFPTFQLETPMSTSARHESAENARDLSLTLARLQIRDQAISVPTEVLAMQYANRLLRRRAKVADTHKASCRLPGLVVETDYSQVNDGVGLGVVADILLVLIAAFYGQRANSERGVRFSIGLLARCLWNVAKPSGRQILLVKRSLEAMRALKFSVARLATGKHVEYRLLDQLDLSHGKPGRPARSSDVSSLPSRAVFSDEFMSLLIGEDTRTPFDLCTYLRIESGAARALWRAMACANQSLGGALPVELALHVGGSGASLRWKARLRHAEAELIRVGLLCSRLQIIPDTKDRLQLDVAREMNRLRVVEDGFVYAFRHPALDRSLIKIGFTQTSPETRLKDLNAALGKSRGFRHVHAVRVQGCKQAETFLHATLKHKRIEAELFAMSDEEAVRVLDLVASVQKH